jgi:pimeloyl-ACP methyl ester carboxylesterase
MTFAVNGIDMHWDSVGDGEPLLWLHGALGCGADWRHIFKDAPEGYRLLAPDLRGHGASTNPSGAFSFRQCAVDVFALLDDLGITTIKAIGLSGGGLTLIHMATMQPARLESVVLVSAPPYFPEQARMIQRQFSPSMVGETEMARMRACHIHGAAQIDQLFAMVRGLADSYDDVNFTPPFLATITADTLIVFGDRDALYPVTLAMDMHTAIPRSHLWIVPNGGHGPVFGDAAPQFAATALRFLGGEWRPPVNRV